MKRGWVKIQMLSSQSLLSDENCATDSRLLLLLQLPSLLGKAQLKQLLNAHSEKQH